jgi:hypothetical protein
MNIYLMHPVHGRKIATMEQEAVYDEENGWSRYNPDEPNPTSELEDELPTNALNVKRKYTRKAVTEEI